MNSKIKYITYKKAFTNIIFLLAILLISLFSASYAWYSFSNKNINFDTVTGTWENVTPLSLDIDIMNVKIANIKKETTSESYKGQDYSEFSITNNENFNVTLSIDMTEISISPELQNNYFIYTIVDSETNKKINEGNFSEATNGGIITMTTNLEIPAKKTNNYKLYLWIKDDKQCVANSDGTLQGKCSSDPNAEDYNTQNDMMNKSFSGKIAITNAIKK